MGKREKTEKFILKQIKRLAKTDHNVNIYKNLFKSMNDREFEVFMLKLKDGKILNLIVPHDLDSEMISVEDNLEILEEMNYSAFQYILIDEEDGKRKTYEKFLVMPVMFRATKQTVEKGTNVSMGDKRVDVLTGQPIGDDQASKISLTQVQLMTTMGLNETLKELVRDRGGDPEGYRAFKSSLLKYGKVNDKIVDAYRTSRVSSDTLTMYFNAMHFKINLKHEME